jgi:hypothetical protein
MAIWIALIVVFVGLFVVFAATRSRGSQQRSRNRDTHSVGSDGSASSDRHDDRGDNDSGGGDSGGGGDGGGGGGGGD